MIELTPLFDGKNFRVDAPIYYPPWVVPIGFITDGPSIPWLFRWVLPVWCRYGKAAILHDYLYRCTDLPRKECDKHLKIQMRKDGVKPWRIFLIYWAVRLFGWWAFYKDRHDK